MPSQEQRGLTLHFGGLGKISHQGAEIYASFQPRKSATGWQAFFEDFAGSEQTAEHGVPAERVVWAVVELQSLRVGTAFLRELES